VKTETENPPVTPSYFTLLQREARLDNPLNLAYIEDMDNYTVLRGEQEAWCYRGTAALRSKK